MNPEDKLIVALDYEEESQALELAKRLEGRVKYFKVGSQLFTARGAGIIEKLRAGGAEVFLDMKFHDIPNTVAGAVASACGLGVFMMTMHATGGPEMLSRARQAAEKAAGGGRRPILLAITVLTSMNAETFGRIGFKRDIRESVLALAEMAKESGMDGVVSSPEETGALRAKLGPQFTLVTPGIRPKGSDVGDQKRIATPSSAIAAGADYLVVGRPITAAADPVKACEAILAEIKGAL
jgi:orotidine-5'-phosphate decarboxylase